MGKLTYITVYIVGVGVLSVSFAPITSRVIGPAISNRWTAARSDSWGKRLTTNLVRSQPDH